MENIWGEILHLGRREGESQETGLCLVNNCKLFSVLHFPSIFLKSSIKSILKYSLVSAVLQEIRGRLALASNTPVKETALTLSPEVTGKEPAGPAACQRTGSRKKGLQGSTVIDLVSLFFAWNVSKAKMLKTRNIFCYWCTFLISVSFELKFHGAIFHKVFSIGKMSFCQPCYHQLLHCSSEDVALCCSNKQPENLSGIKQEGFISCLCYLPTVGQLWSLLKVILFLGFRLRGSIWNVPSYCGREKENTAKHALALKTSTQKWYKPLLLTKNKFHMWGKARQS